MATGSARPARNLRSGRFRVRHETTDEVVVKLDHSREPGENVKEILKNVVAQQGVTSGRKTAYLNSFVKLIKFLGYDNGLGMPIPDIMSCLVIGLLNEAKQVRTASIRVIRHLLPYTEALDSFLLMHFDFLIARCLDVSLDNEIERIHAFKLIRHIIKTSPERFPRSLLYALVAVGNDGASERDRMVRVALETICELAFSNIDLVAKCGGIQTLLWNILDCHQYPRLNEALTSTIIYLLNHPKTRHYIRPQVDLESLLAPFTDSHFRYSIEDGRSEERETRFIASKMAVITVMRSWPGLIRLCHPEGTGMQSLIGILYLPYVNIRKYILEVISDLFRLTLPAWADDFGTAFSSVDRSEMKDMWKLTEGFVAEEGRTILPHISQTRPNLIDNHLALLLSAWITAGLFEALVEVVISSDGPLFNRAVILLGELLHMANALLPPECVNHSDCLPTLIAVATSKEMPTEKRHRAYRAVMNLTRFHKMMKRGWRPCTPFLDQLMQHAGKMSEVTSKHWHLRREKLSEYYFKKVVAEDMTSQAIRDSEVTSAKTHQDWKWSVISAILKWPDDKLKKLDDQSYVKFIRKLVFFYKPENDLFSKIDIIDMNKKIMCQVGCHLIDFLVSSSQEEADKLITEWLSDISENLKELTKLNVPVDENAMFGARQLHEKMCRYYFLFVGRFSASKKGCQYLEKNGIIQSLLELMVPDTHSLYVKLAVSSLNYSLDASTRPILSKALTSTMDVCRLYATKLLRVLMRAGTPGFSSWGMELLVTQLYDPEKSIAMSAINILDEACDNEENLQYLVRLRPSLLHLGEKGVMLLSKFVSTIKGFRSLNDANFINTQLQKWAQTFNSQYVHIVEEMLNEALMTYEKTFSGSCPRRSILKGPKKDVFLPVHLYGQLTMHEEGLELLHKQDCIQEYFNCIHNQILLNDKDIHTLKTALWAVGHIGLSVDGLLWLEVENVIPELIRLAEECGVFSIRGTTFYILSLLSCTRKGTDVLKELGWEARCHKRKEVWPVLDQDGWLHGPMEEALRLSDQAAGLQAEGGRFSSYSSMALSLIHEENFIRNPRPDSQVTLRGSFSSLHSVREPISRNHSAYSPLSDHAVPHISQATLAVPNSNVSRSQTLPHKSNDFHRYLSKPSRSNSEKGIPKTPNEFHPRAQSMDKEVRGTEVESDPVSIESVRLEMDGADLNSESSTDGSAKRDSIHLISSPIIKLRTSSDEDSAILSDNNCDNQVQTVYDGADTDVTLRKHSAPSSRTNRSAEREGEGEMVSFQVGAGGGGGSNSSVLSNKDSSSSDSSHPGKSRGSSFNTTDSSGVSSCDSCPATATTANTTISTVTTPSSTLTPIPSSSSLAALSASSSLLTGELAKEPVHPSAAQRSLFRLSRVPSSKRRSASPALGITANGGQGYTSYRDSVGYAALRSIKRQRTYSAEGDGDGGTFSDAPRIVRTISQDSESSVDSNMWLSMRRNVSSASLGEPDAPSSPISTLNRAAFKPLSPANRFVGITLPVDVKMVFEVVEGEDKRTRSIPMSTEKAKNTDVGLTIGVPPLKKETSFEHSTDTCLLCNRYRQCVLPSNEAKASEPNCTSREQASETGVSTVHNQNLSETSRLRGGSMNEPATSVTPGSQTSSSSSQDMGAKKLSEENEEGRELIRLEVMRLIVNLGSSVGLKGSESGLLSLKQRFPKCFQNVCFYSEVCHLLATYSYRLLARRFIQELFDDLDISVLLVWPYQTLDLELDPSPHMAPIRQDSMDEFHDFSFS